jgi:hypothetical protein
MESIPIRHMTDTHSTKHLTMQLIDSLLIKRIRECGPPLSEEDVQAFEREIGARLPEDYRWFLKTYNGGCYYDEMFIEFPTPRGPVGDSIGFIGFYSVNASEFHEASSIRFEIQIHQDRIPSRMIPIGGSCEDLLLLDLIESGRIYLWERDLELAVEHPNDNKYFLANSFTEFALGCRYISDDERESFGIEKEEPFRSIELRRNEDLIQQLDDGFPLFETNEQDQTPLYVACRDLNYEAAEELLQRGADPNDGDRGRGYPPLYAAAAPGASELAKLLLSHGASPYMDAERTRPIIDNLPSSPSKHIRAIFEEYMSST